jgi:hypothetical protein
VHLSADIDDTSTEESRDGKELKITQALALIVLGHGEDPMNFRQYLLVDGHAVSDVPLPVRLDKALGGRRSVPDGARLPGL